MRRLAFRVDNPDPPEPPIMEQRRCEVCQAFLPLKADERMPWEDSIDGAVVAGGFYELRVCRKCKFANVYNTG